MHECKLYIYKMRIISLILLASVLALTLVSCGRNVDCYSLATEFGEAFGTVGTVFSPRVAETDSGYVSQTFFSVMYSEENIHSEDYAIWLCSRADASGEAAFFLAFSEWDAISIEGMLLSRIDLIGSVFGKGEGSPANGAFVMRSGKLVVMCATGDNERARTVVKMIT